MKNIPLRFVMLLMILVACQTKEEKAAKLIKEEMYKTLYDFSSYEPIETTVDSAFTSIYRDSVVISYAYLMADYVDKSKEYIEKAQNAQSSLEIWRDSYSTYGLAKYNQAKEEFNSNLDKATEYMARIRKIQKLTKERAANFQPSFCGWEAKHKFRCKTKGGSFDLPSYLFIFDPNLKRITYRENMEDEKLISLRNLIDEAINDDSSPDQN